MSTSVFARGRPERALAWLVLGQLVLWSLAPALSHSAPPLDVVEMYAWGREHVVATFKHPNLPGLVLEATRWLTGGATGWPAYVVSQIFIGITFWAAFELGRELMDAKRALAGVLFLTGVYFFFWPTPEFNHNVAQMPLWALTILFLWRAGNDGKLTNWLLLGLFGGLSLWAKYSSAVLLVVAAIWILWDAQARKKLLTLGPWAALVTFALVAAPQALWLVQHQFEPFAYAERRAGGGSVLAPFAFLLTLVVDHAPAFLLLLAAGFFGKAAPDAPPRPDQRAMRFLLLLGLGPVVLTALGGLLGGASLRASWAAPMFALSGLLMIAWLAPKFSEARLKRLAIGAAVVLVLGSSLYFAHMRFGAQFTNHPLKGNWPEAALSHDLQDAWREETNAPLRVVAGDIWTAGLVGLDSRDPPSVLINGDYAVSPWVTRDEVAQSGALLVWREGDTLPPPLVTLSQGLEVKTVIVPFEHFPHAAPVTLHYAVIRPAVRP